MNINAIQNYDSKNKTSFQKLKVVVKGAEFEKNLRDKKLIEEAIKNDEGLKKFFSNHNGKITVTSGTVKVPVTHDYPECLKRVPGQSLPFDQFTLEEPSYCTNIKCEYNRAFALRNLFRKPVKVEAGVQNKNEVLSWNTCVDYTLRLIKEKLADAIQGCEQRRLKVEKP